MLLVGAVLACTVQQLPAVAQVFVDGQHIVRQLSRFTLYANTSIVFAPPAELAGRAEGEFGRPRIFDTEIGVSRCDPTPELSLNRKQATGVSSFFCWSRDARQLHLFPWVLMHDSSTQMSLTAFLPDLRMMPFGAALKMWALQKKDEVSIEWKEQSGRVYAVATSDEGGMAIQMWNDSAAAASVQVIVSQLPRSLLSGKVYLREYRIDSQHSVPSSKAKAGLEMVREETRPTTPSNWDVSFESYSLAL